MAIYKRGCKLLGGKSATASPPASVTAKCLVPGQSSLMLWASSKAEWLYLSLTLALMRDSRRPRLSVYSFISFHFIFSRISQVTGCEWNAAAVKALRDVLKVKVQGQLLAGGHHILNTNLQLIVMLRIFLLLLFLFLFIFQRFRIDCRLPLGLCYTTTCWSTWKHTDGWDGGGDGSQLQNWAQLPFSVLNFMSIQDCAVGVCLFNPAVRARARAGACVWVRACA